MLVYPILATFGLAWAVMFFFRWRRYHCLGDIWASLLGLTIAIWAGGGLIATWVAGTDGGYGVRNLRHFHDRYGWHGRCACLWSGDNVQKIVEAFWYR